MDAIMFKLVVFLCKSIVSGAFYLNLLEAKYNKFLIFFLWCGTVTGLSMVVADRFNLWIQLLFYAITSGIFVLFCFEKKWKEKLIAYVSECSVSFLSAFLSHGLYYLFYDKKFLFIDNYGALNYLIRSLYLVIFSILISIIFQCIRKIMGVELLWVLITQIFIGIGECTAILLISQYNSRVIQEGGFLLLITICCMVSSNMSIGLLAPYFIRRVSMAKNIDYGNELSGMEYKYYEISVENDKKIREIRHDISNQIQVIYSLLKSGDREKSLDLINELKDRYSKVERLVYCENPVVNVILSNKKVEAEQKGIDVHITIKESLKNLPITDFDISTVICNLIDNAIRGCVCSEQLQPKLIVEMLYKNNYLVIRVLNSCKVSMTIESTDRIETTKSNSQTHGFGMPIVSSISKKYNGDFIVSAQNGIFTATAVFQLQRFPNNIEIN